jgi:hypothetical protein
MGVLKNATLLRLTSATAAVNQVSPGFDIGIAASETPVGPVLGLLATLLVALWRITTPLPPVDSTIRTQKPS